MRFPHIIFVFKNSNLLSSYSDKEEINIVREERIATLIKSVLKSVDPLKIRINSV